LGVWTIGARAAVPRTYHSSAVLLPNGTVLTGGGGAVNNHPGRLNVEVYYPPYLFTQVNGNTVLAPRPSVLSINTLKFNHGGTIRARVNAGQAITNAALITGSYNYLSSADNYTEIPPRQFAWPGGNDVP
jgi:galactose oxidase